MINWPNKRILLIAALAFNLGMLLYFKYYDFFLENINLLFHTDFALKNILLPLGISFFTFQQISFVIDVDTHDFLPVVECTFIADKGYDAKNIYNQVKSLYTGECIIPLNMRNTENQNFFHRETPSVMHALLCGKMESSPTAVGQDRSSAVPLKSSNFKDNYPLRTECERYNSRFKNTGQEGMRVRNKASVTNLNTLAYISLLAVAVAAVTTQSGQSYRKFKFVKQIT